MLENFSNTSNSQHFQRQMPFLVLSAFSESYGWAIPQMVIYMSVCTILKKWPRSFSSTQDQLSNTIKNSYEIRNLSVILLAHHRATRKVTPCGKEMKCTRFRRQCQNEIESVGNITSSLTLCDISLYLKLPIVLHRILQLTYRIYLLRE